MATETIVENQASEQEQQWLHLMRELPPNRRAELIDFAEFLQTRVEEAELDEAETEEAIRASEEKWDALFAREDAQRLMEQMADEALEEYRAGRTRPIVFTEDGEIAPG